MMLCELIAVFKPVKVRASPGVLLVLSVEFVGLLSFLRHPPRHQLLIVLGCFP